MMNYDQGNEDQDTSQQETNERDHRREESDKILNYANLRATDIPTVPRLYPPKPSTVKNEGIMTKIKEKLMETVAEYKGKHCDRKGRVLAQNITKEETEAMNQLKKRVKDKSVVIFTTDKSGRFSVDTPENYEKAVSEHTKNDVEINQEEVKQIENKLNQHMRQFNRMFKVGTVHNQENRITGATKSINTPAPRLYGLRKNHKETLNEMDLFVRCVGRTRRKIVE